MSAFDIFSQLNKQGTHELYETYVREHIENVQKAYNWINTHIGDWLSKTFEPDFHKLDVNVYNHDASKFMDEEFDAYAQWFYGDGTKTDKKKIDFDYAWNHHQKMNPHHPDYWCLIDDVNGFHILDMPIEYIIEMICDWFAFSFKAGNLWELIEWSSCNIDKKPMTKKTYTITNQILMKIKEQLIKEGYGQ